MTAEPVEIAAPPAQAVRHLHAVPRPYVPLEICRCGHETDAHPLVGCDVCGPVRCHGFRRRTGRGARSSFRP